MVFVLWALDGQMLVEDEIKHSLLHHHQGSATKTRRTQITKTYNNTRRETKLTLKRNKDSRIKHLNCLDCRLVDLLKISIDSFKFPHLFPWPESLVCRKQITGIWHELQRQDRSKRRRKNKKESNKKRYDWVIGRIMRSKSSHFYGMLLLFLCCSFCCNSLCLYTLVLSCSVKNAKWFIPRFCPWKWIFLHIHTKQKPHQKEKIHRWFVH